MTVYCNYTLNNTLNLPDSLTEDEIQNEVYQWAVNNDLESYLEEFYYTTAIESLQK